MVRVHVRWKDLHQRRFAVEVSVEGEVADFPERSSRPEEGRGASEARTEAGAEEGEAKAGTSKEDKMMEEALRRSLEEHQKLQRVAREAMSRRAGRTRAVMHMQQWWESLVDVARGLVRLRRQHRLGADELNLALRRRLRQLERCVPAGAYIPLGGSESAMEEVVAVAAEESSCLQTPHKVHLLLVLETRVCPHGCSRLSARATLPEASARDVPFISPDEEPLAEEPCFVVKQTAKGRGAEEVEGVSVASEAVVSSPSKRGGEGGDVMGDSWKDVQARVKEASQHAALWLAAGGKWSCRSLIVKAHDDLRQDELAAKLLFLFDDIFKREKLPLPLRPYAVLATSGIGGGGGGMLETVTDAVSIDALKKRVAAIKGPGAGTVSLLRCFEFVFGERGQRRRDAQARFLQSMAAYSVFCYALHVKDRHNANILLCRDGAVAHVDFGIMLNVRYAKDLVELKIKLSSEFVQVIGQDMTEFERLCVEGFLALRKHSALLLSLLHTSTLAGASGLPCLEGDAVEQVQRRLVLDRSEGEARQHMMAQLASARENMRTDILDLIHDFTHSGV